MCVKKSEQGVGGRGVPAESSSPNDSTKCRGKIKDQLGSSSTKSVPTTVFKQND